MLFNFYRMNDIILLYLDDLILIKFLFISLQKAFFLIKKLFEFNFIYLIATNLLFTISFPNDTFPKPPLPNYLKI